MLVFVVEYFTWDSTTLRISRDLKSLVATGDPKEPCQKQSQSPLFWRVQWFWFLGSIKSPFQSITHLKTDPVRKVCLDTTINYKSLFADPIRLPPKKDPIQPVWGFLDSNAYGVFHRMSLKRSKRPMRSLKPLNGDLFFFVVPLSPEIMGINYSRCEVIWDLNVGWNPE